MNATVRQVNTASLPSTSLAKLVERSRRDKESWRYTDLSALLARDPQTARGVLNYRLAQVLPDAAPHQQRFVFINGELKLEQSSFGNLPRGILQDDGAHGYRLTLAEQSCLVTAPIELVFVVDRPEQDIDVRFVIDVGASASVTLIERHMGLSSSGRSLFDIKFCLAPQSKLVHNKILQSLGQAVHLATTFIEIKEGAYYQSFTLLKDTWLVRNEIDVELSGSLAQCTLNGVMLLRGHEHIDTTSRTLHKAAHGVSQQLYKTIVSESAHGVFQGKIIVAEGAQKTDGRQLSRALLLSDQAEMDSKPELQIFADDVACSHGSTIGDLDPDILFYLRARGLNETEARALLLRAFVVEVIDGIPEGISRDIVLGETERWFDDCGQ